MNTRERIQQFDLMMGHIVNARMKEWLIGQGFSQPLPVPNITVRTRVVYLTILVRWQRH